MFCTGNVPGTPNPLADNDYAELCALVHPLESSSDFGVDGNYMYMLPDEAAQCYVCKVIYKLHIHTVYMTLLQKVS